MRHTLLGIPLNCSVWTLRPIAHATHYRIYVPMAVSRFESLSRLLFCVRRSIGAQTGRSPGLMSSLD